MKQLNLFTVGLLVLSLTLPMGLSAQKASKVSQSIKVDDEVTVDLNTSFCNIELDTWNRDIVEVEAYIDGEKLTPDELQKALKQWDVDVDATSSYVSITTGGKHGYQWDYDFHFEGTDAMIAAIDELKFELADIPEIHVEIPEFEFELPEIPELPELPEGISNMNFDYDAYKKDGEKYMEEWGKEFEKKFGKDYERKMEAWADKFSKEWEEKYGKEWEEKFSKEMEKWGESFGKQMEELGKQMEEKMKAREEHQKDRAKLAEERAKLRVEREKMREERKLVDEQRSMAEAERKAKIESMINSSANPNVKKVIKIKVPKKAKLKINVKHGELKLASTINDLKANLMHTGLVANDINGSETSINVSYAPVVVNNWDLGKLTLNYVDQAQLTNVNHLVLSANSSNVVINQVNSNAIVDGSFGVLKILNVNPDFSGMNLVLQNSDAILVLPKTNFNLQYKGNQTFLKHPKNTKKELVKEFSLGNLGSAKVIVLNAKFSDIKLQ